MKKIAEQIGIKNLRQEKTDRRVKRVKTEELYSDAEWEPNRMSRYLGREFSHPVSGRKMDDARSKDPRREARSLTGMLGKTEVFVRPGGNKREIILGINLRKGPKKKARQPAAKK